MNISLIRLAATVGLLAVAHFLIQAVWVKGRTMWLLLLVMALGVYGLALIQRLGKKVSPDEAELNVDAPSEKKVRQSPIAVFAAAAGLLFWLGAYSLTMSDQLLMAGGMIVGMAVVWRPLLRVRADNLGSGTTWLLLLLVISTGALFRFYEVGEIPVGLIKVDEPRLMPVARDILEGKRQTFSVQATIEDGAIPFYMQALSMKIFGTGVTGYRLAGVFSGMLILFLFYGIGKESGGPRLGLAAAGIAAMAVWPVTLSRAEYLMAETYVPIMACLYFFMLGVRRDKALAFAFAGLCFGLSFNVYKSGQLVFVLVPVLAFLYLYWNKDRRLVMARGLVPFIGGSLLSLAPLFYWYMESPEINFHHYFSSLYAKHIIGTISGVELTFSQKLSAIVGRILPNMAKVMTMMTTSGTMRHWYFVAGEPIISRMTLSFFIAGLSVCLARFRRPAYAFMIIWFFVGLTPTLVSNPNLNMDERRIMLSMPAVMLISGVGLLGVIELLGRGMAVRWRRWLTATALILFFGQLGTESWDEYFVGINKNPHYMDYHHANYAKYVRAVWEENDKDPVFVVSMKKPNKDDWNDANFETNRIEYSSVNRHIPTAICSVSADYFAQGGLIQYLRATHTDTDGKALDHLVVLTPFHFYLESMLVNELGGKRVLDLKVVQTSVGPLFQDVGMALDGEANVRLIRIKNMNSVRLEKAASRYVYSFLQEEIDPPAELGSRAKLLEAWTYTSVNIAHVEDFASKPEGWKKLRRQEFSVMDPYFWVTANNLPGHLTRPYRLSGKWILNIETAGEYAFGGSSSLYLGIKIDGKKVFKFIPKDNAIRPPAREGILGEKVYLEKGLHDFEWEQVMISTLGNYNQLMRLMWQKPGGEKETLPMEKLFPTREIAGGEGL